MSRRAVVTGAGGFIGFHMVRYLKAQGYYVRGVDIVEPEFAPSDADEFEIADLRLVENCIRCVNGMDEVYQLAADMGGIGYITSVRADVARNNALINAHMIGAAADQKVSRYFFSSTACIYPVFLQDDPDVAGLKETDAYPAQPEEGYGWEKLFAEKLCEYYTEEGKLDTRIARFHNVYGPLGTYAGGREKAPAALSRKIAMANDGDEIEVWGDGEQTRSFMYIDDCVEGIHRITQSEHSDPLNLGTDELISVNGLVDLIASIAGKKIGKKHNLDRPQGVRGRNSDNDLLRHTLGWEPRIALAEGLVPTYAWIKEQVATAVKVIDLTSGEQAPAPALEPGLAHA
jgi:GDP-D-mannose 3',5'-epimerase